MTYDQDLQDINWSETFDTGATEEDVVPEEYIQALQKNFGHSRFRAMQWKVISSILDNNRDNCVIMATGYGKSLCYQFPSVYRDTITIVISPLISLMQDQVLAMCFYKLRACFLGSAQTNRDTVYEVIDRKYNVVYVTPEYITSEAGAFLLNRIQEHLTLIAIDEAHCISKWGHDFRGAYRSLTTLRDLCPTVPILAMTATATAQVRDDIIHTLKLKNPQILSTGFDRPNLKFIVKPATNIWADIGQYILSVKIGSVIVYCITRRISEEVASVIAQNGQRCGVYHAGISLKQRQETHDDFIHDRIRVVVATVAFGMGINKPDVRLVIHYGVAKDVESYYQEVGRAGRDGLPSKCIMFYRAKDWALHRMIRERQKEASKEQLEKLMQTMVMYVGLEKCRRRFILSYFGENCNALPLNRDCCDICERACYAPAQPINLFARYQDVDKDGLLNITDESYKILLLIQDVRAKYGQKKILRILKGSKAKDVPAEFFSHPLFGSLRNKPEKWLQCVCNTLLNIKMLGMVNITTPSSAWFHTYPRWTVSADGIKWLATPNREPIKIVPGADFTKLLKPKVLYQPKNVLPVKEKPAQDGPSTSAQADSTTSSSALSSSKAKPSSDIYRPLLKVRSKLGSLFGVMPYLVASTRALQQLAELQPTTMAELRNIALDGYSEEKTERFGPVFIKVIKDFHEKNGKPVKTEKTTAVVKIPSAENEKQIPIKQESDSVGSADLKPFQDITNTIIIDDDDDDYNEEPLEPTQDSVQIIEPPTPPTIEIDSDLEEAAFTDSSDSDDLRLDEVTIKVENELNNSVSENNDLDMLINAIECGQQQNEVKKSQHVIKREPLLDLEYENGSNSDSDLFDEEWGTDIDELELTHISQQAEEKFKGDAIVKDAGATSSQRNEGQITAETTELDLLLEAVKQDLNENCESELKKPRVIMRKETNMFEYEDDSDSEPENNTVAVPMKRSLPSWMHLSYKKLR